MELIKKITSAGFDISIGFAYSDYHSVEDLCPELSITKERVDGSSIKITREGYPRANFHTFWATNTNNNDYFEQDVELARKYFRDIIVCYDLVVVAYKNGIELGESRLGGCYSENYGDDLFNEYEREFEELIDNAITEALENIKKLCA